MGAPVITVGIDLASQPKRTAVCAIRWQPGGAEVLSVESGADDDAVLRVIEGADKVGIDVPFGWPVDFARAVRGHTTDGRWPADADPTTRAKHLQFRATDRFVNEKTRRWPLSVSSDRIAIPAMRAAALFARLAQAGQSVARDGSGQIVEVYPAAALRAWNLAATAYKGPATTEARHKLLDSILVSVPTLQVIDERRAPLIDSDDALDALVASLVARAAAVGAIEPIPSIAETVAAQEGWIALPRPGTLGALI